MLSKEKGRRIKKKVPKWKKCKNWFKLIGPSLRDNKRGREKV